MTAPGQAPIKVLSVDLCRRLPRLEFDPRYASALISFTLDGRVIGEVLTDVARGVVTPARSMEVLAQGLGREIYLDLTREVVTAALRGAGGSPSPSSGRISVLVARPRSEAALERCLESIGKQTVEPATVEVVDAPDALRREDLCGPSDLVAFIDGALEVDPGWVAAMDAGFRDPLTMALVGYVGPAELETAAQVEAGLPPRRSRTIRPRLLDGAPENISPAFARPAESALEVANGVNTVFRRAFIEHTGGPTGAMTGIPAPRCSELALLYRALTGGYRVRYDPGVVGRYRLPADAGDLAAARRRAAREAFAFASRTAIGERDPNAARAAGRAFLTRRPPWARPRPRQDLPSRAPSFREVYASDTNREADRLPAAVHAELSVLIPSHQRREKLLTALTALANQTLPPERFEVIVVVDGGADGSAEAVRDLSVPYRLRIIEQPHTGVAAARNVAVQASTAPILVFIDDDMVPEPAFLAAHASAHTPGTPETIAIGYSPSDPGSSGAWELLLRAWWEEHYRRMSDPDYPWTWIDFSVGNASLSRRLFERAGGFDERFTRRNEDQEMGVRLTELGATFRYLPAARAWHRFEIDAISWLGDARRQGAFDVHLVEKYPRLDRRVFARALFTDDRRLRRKPAIAWRFPRFAGALVPPLMRLAPALERLRMRRTWHWLTGELRATAYVLGVRDAIGRKPRLPGEPTAPAVIEVELGASAAAEVPQTGAEPLLSINFRGQQIGSVEAMGVGKVWSWDDVIERTSEAVVDRLAAELTLDELRRLASTPEREQ